MLHKYVTWYEGVSQTITVVIYINIAVYSREARTSINRAFFEYKRTNAPHFCDK